MTGDHEFLWWPKQLAFCVGLTRSKTQKEPEVYEEGDSIGSDDVPSGTGTYGGSSMCRNNGGLNNSGEKCGCNGDSNEVGENKSTTDCTPKWKKEMAYSATHATWQDTDQLGWGKRSPWNKKPWQQPSSSVFDSCHSPNTCSISNGYRTQPQVIWGITRNTSWCFFPMRGTKLEKELLIITSM